MMLFFTFSLIEFKVKILEVKLAQQQTNIDLRVFPIYFDRGIF
jgi:hypothetical protein